jgi:plasmid maintenance system antidote protein VapI
MSGGDLAGEIFDDFVAHPDGLTVHDLAEDLHLPLDAIRRGIRETRLILAEDDTLFILADPQGPREPWLYRLVDGAKLIDMTETTWTANRIHDAQSRVHLMYAAMRVAARATDGRSKDGKKARILARACGRLVEDLDDIDLGGD